MALSILHATLSAVPDEGVAGEIGPSEWNQAHALSGVLAETNGGTNQSSFAQGDLLYASAANTLARLAKSASATRYLSNTGASNAPAWAQVTMTTGVSDYEEGSWTPVIQGSVTPGTQTYSSQVGRYIRIGNLVWISAGITMTAKDAATAGNFQVAGFPFAASNISGARMPLVIRTHNVDFSAGYTAASITANINVTAFNMSEWGDNVGAQILGAAAISATTQLDISGCYRIN